jgi:hypothetical protein
MLSTGMVGGGIKVQNMRRVASVPVFTCGLAQQVVVTS